MTFSVKTVAQTIADAAPRKYGDELAHHVLEPKTVRLSEIEGDVAYLDCEETYSLLWNDVITEVIGELDPRSGWWLTDDPGTLYGPEERFFDEPEAIAALIRSSLMEANDVYAEVIRLLEARGYVILPTDWQNGDGWTERQREAFVAKHAEAQLAGKHGREVQQAYENFLALY